MARVKIPQETILMLMNCLLLSIMCKKPCLDFLRLLRRLGNLGVLVCRHVLKRTARGAGKGKSTAAAGTSKRPGSRFNSTYFGQKIIAYLDQRKRNIIQERGFGILLEYDGLLLPKDLCNG